jgi:hypothetical protein
LTIVCRLGLRYCFFLRYPERKLLIVRDRNFSCWVLWLVL